MTLAREVAELLAEAGQRQAHYFGRSAGPPLDTCAAIVDMISQQLPAVTAQMEARDTWGQ